jgi:hypothetical protein
LGDRETVILIAAILRMGHCRRIPRLTSGASKEETIAAGRRNPSRAGVDVTTSSGTEQKPVLGPGTSTGATDQSKWTWCAQYQIDYGGAAMDFSEKLENLKAKAAETAETVQAAAAEDRDQLKQRIDQAQDAASQTMQDVKQQVAETADRGQSKWAQMKADAAARREDMKAKINKRADQLDAKAAAKDADWAEQDAADAIDYAVWMVYDAQLAVLDALDARAYADERAKIASS